MSETELQDTGRRAMDLYRQEANFTRALRQPVALSLALLASIVVIHIGVWALDTTLRAAGGQTGPALYHGAKINLLVLEGGQWWRLVSATFLHGGLLHLAFNAYALFILAPLLERLYGSRRFMLIYMVSGLGGSAASLFFNQGVSVGASGAIFGLLGALLVFGLKFRADLPSQLRSTFGPKLIPWVVVNLVIGFIPGLNIDNAAHTGGLISGILVAAGISSALRERPKGLSAAALEVSFVLCFILIALGLVLMVEQVMLCAGGGEFASCYPASVLGQ